ncbi:MAG: M1 family aminopeptidase [Pyrinomonadaceae bacterium]
MSKRIIFPALLLSVLTFIFPVSAQDPDKNVLGEVQVYAVDPLYKQLRGLSDGGNAFSGEYATVNNLVLKKDEGVFTLKTGEIYFLQPVEGRSFGAVFLGDGEFSLTPPTEIEKKHLALFIEGSEFKEGFKQLVMFFSDQTLEEIKKSAAARMGTGGPQSEKARDAYRDKEDRLRNDFHYNMNSRVLADIYAPDRKGFFTAFIDGNKFGRLIYQIDPLGIPEVYPEQVALVSYGDSTGGIWTAFHMAEEYKKGTATSWQDRRIYDITHHDLDTTVDGTRLVVRDTITLKMREANVRFLPFDLFGSLRVKTVTDEKENGLVFIQEKKDADSDFGVVLREPVEVGKPFTIIVEYEGTEALRDAGDGNFILIPRSTWYPNNQLSSFGDRATFDLTFHFPKKYEMIGIGSRVGEEVVEEGQKTSKWTSGEVEMAVAGFNYGDFKMKEIKDEMTNYGLEVFVNNTLPDEMRAIQLQVEEAERRGIGTQTTLGSLNTSSMAGAVLVEAQNSTRIYTNYFGKLPYQRIAMTQQPAGFFGQAWGTLIFMPYIAFIGDTHRVQLFGIRGGTDGFWREVAPHEVAHQWWGHMVGWTSYHDQWMSEGFSEFSTSLYIQYVKRDTDKFIDFWEDQRKLITEGSPATRGRKPYTVGPVTQGYRLNSAKTGNIARAMIYPKGAFILHMLRMMMFDHRNGTGDAKFKEMMKDFIASHYNQDVSTNDFKKIVEKHMLPEMDIDQNKTMDWFFDEWVYGTEMPSYKMTYTVGSEGGKTVLSGKVTQSNVSDRFVMLVPIYVDFGKGWVYLGSARMVGNSTVDLGGIKLPTKPKKVAVAALEDVLAEKIENKKE